MVKTHGRLKGWKVNTKVDSEGDVSTNIAISIEVKFTEEVNRALGSLTNEDLCLLTLEESQLAMDL